MSFLEFDNGARVPYTPKSLIKIDRYSIGITLYKERAFEVVQLCVRMFALHHSFEVGNGVLVRKNFDRLGQGLSNLKIGLSVPA